MKNKIVVLGASGFIGKALCNDLTRKNKNFLGYSSTECNLLYNEAVYKLNDVINNDDIIVFISALAPCKDNDMYKKNLTMLSNLINAVKNIKLKHIIYISSDAVYEDSNDLINEQYNKTSANFHAKMHNERENVITKYCNLENINLTILRPTLVYGPGDTHNGYGPNKFIRDLNNNKNIILFGKGEEKRDHIYIKDVVSAITISIEKNIIGNFTIATGNVISFLDIAKIVCKVKNVSESMIKFKERNGPMPHNGYRAFDVSSFKKRTNLKYLEIEEGIRSSIKKLF